MRTTAILTGSLALALGFSSCSGGGGGGGGDSSAATAEFLVSSVGDGDLFALTAEITELRLCPPGGGRTDDLLTGPVTLEFVGMEDVAEWLTKVEIPAGEYAGVLVEFDPDSVTAMSGSGAELLLEVPEGTWELAFDRNLVVERGETGRLELVLDLDESLAGDIVFPAPPQFVPQGDVYELGDGGGDRPVDELDGLVVEVSLVDSSFGIEVFRDEMMNDSLGVLTVVVGPDTELIDDNDLAFADQSAFFASLRVGLTVVEVHGVLDDMGVFQADRIEIEDQGGMRPPAVEMEGLVLHVFDEVPAQDSAAEGQFVMLIQEIEEGADIADPVLEGIGNPSAIDVIWDADTVFVGPSGEEIPRELGVGQMVDVAFDEFAAPPFLAVEIEFEFEPGERCFEGVITAVDGDSGEIEIRVDDDDDHEDDRYDEHEDFGDDRLMSVDLSEAELCLNLRNRPSLEVSELVTGLKIEVCGTLERREDDPDGPDEPETDPDRGELVFVASRAKVKPGHLIKGIPGEVDTEACTLVLASSQIVQTFGDDVTGSAPTVLFDEDADWRNDASSKEGFFRLFDSLAADETLDLKIKGIGSGELDEIVAYEIKVKVRGDSGGGGHE